MFNNREFVKDFELLQGLPRMEFEVEVDIDKKAERKRKKELKKKQTPDNVQLIDIKRVFNQDEQVKKREPKKYEEFSPTTQGFKIGSLPTEKTKVEQRQIMKDGIIPSHPSSVIANGKSGSGKTTLLISLLIDPRFYGKGGEHDSHYFDRIYLFSPTAGSCDDLVQQLYRYTPLLEEDTFTEFDETKLNEILEEQKETIDRKGIADSPKTLILLEDIQSDQDFLRSKTILKLFLMNRHFNISTWLCSQSYTKTPRACRLQANNIFYFRGSASETEKIIDEYAPDGLTKREFKLILDKFVFNEPHDFLHYNMRRSKKYSKNLDTYLAI